MMDILQDIIVFGGAFAALSLMFAKLIKLFKTWFHFVDDWNGTEDRAGVKERLDFIESELRPNHGSSIKDQISRLGARQTEIFEHIKHNK
jgi:hypothetical protein